MAKAAEESVGAMGKGVGYWRESWDELKKVHSPTRQETIAMTVRVFALVALFGVFLGLTDFFVGSVMKALLTS